MSALCSICKKDDEYKEMIKESYYVKNAVVLLGGRREREKTEGLSETERKEGEAGVGRKEEEKGGMEIDCIEMKVREKILLIELLSELVKGGMEIAEEEELKELLMELEEEGNSHLEVGMEREEEEEEEEEEADPLSKILPISQEEETEQVEETKTIEEGEEEEEKEGEKREWEELSEKAHQLAWMMERMKKRREGKKSETLKRMKKEKEDMKQKMEEVEETIERMKVEMEKMKNEGTLHTPPPTHTPSTSPPPFNTPPITSIVSSVITSLDEVSVLFPQSSDIKREGNTIVHHAYDSYRHCFIGGVMTSV